MKEDYRFNMYESLKEIVRVMAYNDLEISKKIIYIALKGLNTASELDSIAYLECFRGLLYITDQYHFTRIRLIFGVSRL